MLRAKIKILNKMAILRAKEISKMSEKEIDEKTKDLKMELIKNKVNASKSGKLRTKEIKKTIARLITFNKLNKKSVETKNK